MDKNQDKVKKVVIYTIIIVLTFIVSVMYAVISKDQTNMKLATELINTNTDNVVDNMQAEWAKAIGGSSDDEITCILETNDGGYVVGGQFKSKSIELGNGVVLNNKNNYMSIYSYDGMLIKYGSNGEAEWGKVIGEKTSDSIWCITETTDGGIVIGGDFDSQIDLGNGVILESVGYNDGMLIKYRSDGEVEWAKKIGSDKNECIQCVIGTKDGGIIAGGNFNSSTIELGNGVVLNNRYSAGYYNATMIIKYRSDGEVEWGKVIEKSYIFDIIETKDGGYAIGGHFSDIIDLGNGVVLNNKGNNNGMVIKYGSDGEVEWGKAIGGERRDEIVCITEATDGGIIAGGDFNSSTIELENGLILNNNSIIIIKYDANGNLEWTNSIQSSDSSYIKSIDETRDRGYIVGVCFRSSTVDLGNGILLNNMVAIIKYDRESNIQWVKEFGQSDHTSRCTVKQTKDRGYIVVGNFKGNIDLGNGIKLNNETTSNHGMIVKYKDLNAKNETTVEVSTERVENAKSQNITITTKYEEGIEASSSNSYQYYLSSSSTELTEGEWKDYTSGEEITIGEGKTGEYYLYVKRIEDNEGNISEKDGEMQEIEGITYHKFGPYIFDNSNPVIEIETNGNTEYNKIQSTKVIVNDVGTAGINEGTLKYQWTQTIEEPTKESFDIQGTTFENQGMITKADGTGNNWYLWVQAEDNLGNRTIVRTNEFYLDNTAPTITKAELINNIIKIEANDIDEEAGEGAGIDKYMYITSNTKLDNPEITSENSTVVDITGEITITDINTVKYIYIVVEDKVGNTSQVTEIEVPTIEIKGEIDTESGDGQDGIKLKWEQDWAGDKTYKVYQKGETETEWTEVKITNENETIISSARDEKAPNAPTLEVKGITEDNKIEISQTSEDRGSIYQFYIEICDRTDNSIVLATSDEITIEVKTGVKGYYYTIEEDLTNARNVDNGTYVEENTLKLDILNNGKNIKIKAIDGAGNIGEESSALIYITSKATVNPNGGTLEGSIEAKEIEGLVGQTVDIGIPVKEGYTFKGWKVTSGAIEGTQFTYGKEDAQITAEWQINKYKYTVNYLEKDTNAVLKEAKEVFDAEYQETIISSEEVIKIEGYNFDSSDKVSITIETNEVENVINIYYTIKTDIKYKIEYYYNGEKNEENTIEGQATYKEIIDSYEDKIVEGYILVKEENKPLTIVENENKNIIKIYYAKATTAKVQYIDRNTDVVMEEIIEDGYVGKELKTTAKNFEGYILVEEPEEKTVEMEENMVIKYYYVHISKGVIEKHIDIDTDEIIYNATYEGNEGDEYITEAKQFRGYDLVEEKRPENATGKMGVEAITVNYYYKKKAVIKITVKYMDKNTKEEIQKEIIEGYEGETYTTEQKDIEEYEFVEVIGETSGIMTEDKEIIYYYKMKNQPEIPGEGGAGDEEDPTITNKDIPNAGWTEELIALSAVIVMSITTIVLTVIAIKRTEIYKKYKE